MPRREHEPRRDQRARAEAVLTDAHGDDRGIAVVIGHARDDLHLIGGGGEPPTSPTPPSGARALSADARRSLLSADAPHASTQVTKRNEQTGRSMGTSSLVAQRIEATLTAARASASGVPRSARTRSFGFSRRERWPGQIEGWPAPAGRTQAVTAVRSRNVIAPARRGAIPRRAAIHGPARAGWCEDLRYVTCVVPVGLSNPARFVLRCARVAAVLALALSPATAVAHGAVLRAPTSADPTTLDVELAVAVTPYGTTRWTPPHRRRTAERPLARSRAPRRRARLGDERVADDARRSDLAARRPSHRHAALRHAEHAPSGSAAGRRTGTREIPDAPSSCSIRQPTPARMSRRAGSPCPPTSMRRSTTSTRGATRSSRSSSTVGAGATVSSPTLRISDDGAPVVPLALTGSASAPVHVTAIVIGSGAARPPRRTRARSVHDHAGDGTTAPSAMHARARSSTAAARSGYASPRRTQFSSTALPYRADTPITPLSTGYFREANGQAKPTCDAAARDASRPPAAPSGDACAAGALARVPGGPTCTPTTTPIDPAAFNCGPGVDDLALALAGASPAAAFVTRFTGLVAAEQPRHRRGNHVVVERAQPRRLRRRSTSRARCPSRRRAEQAEEHHRPRSRPCRPATATGPHHYRRSDSGCSGSSTVIVYDDTGDEAPVADEGCGSTSSTGTDDPTTSETSGDNCGSRLDELLLELVLFEQLFVLQLLLRRRAARRPLLPLLRRPPARRRRAGTTATDDDDSSKSDSCDCGKSTTGSSSSSSSSSGDDEHRRPRRNRSSPAEHLDEIAPQEDELAPGEAPRPEPGLSLCLLFVALVLPLRRRLRLKKL